MVIEAVSTAAAPNRAVCPGSRIDLWSVQPGRTADDVEGVALTGRDTVFIGVPASSRLPRCFRDDDVVNEAIDNGAAVVPAGLHARCSSAERVFRRAPVVCSARDGRRRLHGVPFGRNVSPTTSYSACVCPVNFAPRKNTGGPTRSLSADRLLQGQLAPWRSTSLHPNASRGNRSLIERFVLPHELSIVIGQPRQPLLL